jgi:hypothetical protein
MQHTNATTTKITRTDRPAKLSHRQARANIGKQWKREDKRARFS